MKIYNSLLNYAKEKCEFDDIFINGLWEIDQQFQPSREERLFKYKFIVAQSTTGQGAAYCNHDITSVNTKKYIGKSLSRINFMKNEDFSTKIAILDSVYSKIKNKPVCEYIISGSLSGFKEPKSSLTATE